MKSSFINRHGFSFSAFADKTFFWVKNTAFYESFQGF